MESIRLPRQLPDKIERILVSCRDVFEKCFDWYVAAKLHVRRDKYLVYTIVVTAMLLLFIGVLSLNINLDLDLYKILGYIARNVSNIYVYVLPILLPMYYFVVREQKALSPSSLMLNWYQDASSVIAFLLTILGGVAIKIMFAFKDEIINNQKVMLICVIYIVFDRYF